MSKKYLCKKNCVKKKIVLVIDFGQTPFNGSVFRAVKRIFIHINY